MDDGHVPTDLLEVAFPKADIGTVPRVLEPMARRARFANRSPRYSATSISEVNSHKRSLGQNDYTRCTSNTFASHQGWMHVRHDRKGTVAKNGLWERRCLFVCARSVCMCVRAFVCMCVYVRFGRCVSSF